MAREIAKALLALLAWSAWAAVALLLAGCGRGFDGGAP